MEKKEGSIEKSIRNILRDRGMTIRDLSARCGIPDATIHRMFKRNDYKLSALNKIADALGTGLYPIIESELSFDSIASWPTKEVPEVEVRLRIELTEARERIMELKEQIEDKKQIIVYLKEELNQLKS
jgi:predicted transcriptional regulator